MHAYEFYTLVLLNVDTSLRIITVTYGNLLTIFGCRKPIKIK